MARKKIEEIRLKIRECEGLLLATYLAESELKEAYHQITSASDRLEKVPVRV